MFGTVASSISGFFADRFGRDPVVVAGALVMMAGLGGTLMQPLIAVVAAIIVVTIGFFMVHSVASGWVGRLANRDKSHAASLYLLAYYLGSSILGSLGGWFWREAAWPAVVGFCCTLTVGVLGLAGLLRRLRTS
jgi:YNFM family putative membrane transporter